MKFTLLGTGTSQGIPVIACSCLVCHSSDIRDKRLRSSLLITTNNTNIVIDTGPDFRTQMLDNQVKSLSGILYTHEHNDHVVGLDDVRPFIFKQGGEMPLYAAKEVNKVLRDKYDYAFKKNPYPGAPRLKQIDILPGIKIVIEGIPVLPIPIMHGELPILGYRIGNFAYLTDVNFISDAAFQMLDGIEYLVLSALHKRKHHSHYNLEEALEVIKFIDPKEAFLTHISHAMGKTMDWEKELPANVFPSMDGLVIES